MITAIALVASLEDGTPVAGIPCFLKTDDGRLLLADVTNAQGYMVFQGVPTPFDGTIRMGAGVVQYYEHRLQIPEANNVTIRCGPSATNPQDVQLPAVVPFV